MSLHESLFKFTELLKQSDGMLTFIVLPRVGVAILGCDPLAPQQNFSGLQAGAAKSMVEQQQIHMMFCHLLWDNQPPPKRNRR